MKNNSLYFSAFRNREGKVIKQFINICRPGIISLVKKFGHTDLNSDDVLQDALLVVMKRIDEGLNEQHMTASLSTYLYAVAQNQCRDRIKKLRHSAPEGKYEPADNDEDSQVQLYYERVDSVRTLVSKVKEPCNGMLMDYYVYKLSYEEIAEKYGYKNYNSAKKKNGECLKKARNLVASDKSLKAKFSNYA